jgi:hypothetical protein
MEEVGRLLCSMGDIDDEEGCGATADLDGALDTLRMFGGGCELVGNECCEGGCDWKLKPE